MLRYLSNPVPVPLTCILNAWGHNTHPSSWVIMPCANPIENMSAQEIPLVTNAPASQLVAFVPTTQQQNTDRHHRGTMCNNSNAIHNDLLIISHVSHHLDDIVYLKVEYTMDTAVAVFRDIYNCINRHDILHTNQGPIPVSCFTSKDALMLINLIPISLLAPRLVDAIAMQKNTTSII